MRVIQELPGPTQEVLPVGHEPDFGQLPSLLLTGGDTLIINFKKGGGARLAVGNLLAGRCATLDWLLTSRQLEMMA